MMSINQNHMHSFHFPSSSIPVIPNKLGRDSQTHYFNNLVPKPTASKPHRNWYEIDLVHTFIYDAHNPVRFTRI